jgi:hypothetical protein
VNDLLLFFFFFLHVSLRLSLFFLSPEDKPSDTADVLRTERFSADEGTNIKSFCG